MPAASRASRLVLAIVLCAALALPLGLAASPLPASAARPLSAAPSAPAGLLAGPLGWLDALWAKTSQSLAPGGQGASGGHRHGLRLDEGCGIDPSGIRCYGAQQPSLP